MGTTRAKSWHARVPPLNRFIPVAVLVVLTGACLSGCSSPNGVSAPAGPEAAADPPQDPPVFAEARPIMDIPNTGHETFIEVSQDGQTLLACAHGDFRAPVHMYASTDGGATFRELAPGLGWPVAGDCDVALSEDGSPNGLWAFAGKTDLGITVATTRDGGQTWTVNHLAGPPLNGLADRQWLQATTDGLVLAYQPGTQQVGSILVTRSADDGATWSQPVEAAAPDPAAAETAVGHFVVAQSALLLPLLRNALQATGRFALLASTDGGATWTERPAFAVGADAYPTGLAATADGRLVWAFIDAGQLFAAASSDDGLTWSTPVPLAAGVAWDRPWASARPDGSVDVVWMSDGSHFDSGAGLALTRVPANFSEAPMHWLVAPIGFIEFASVAHDGNGLAHVAVVDAPRLISADPQLGQGLAGRLLLVQERSAAPW